MLVGWICRSLEQRGEQAEARLKEMVEEFSSLLDHIVTSHEGYFGDHAAYMPHISKDEVARGRAAIAKAEGR
jgi:hypothetical protein